MPISGTRRPRGPIYKLAIAAAVSGTGTNMAAVAVSLDVYGMTKSPLWLAVTMMGAFGISGLLSPVAGYLVDRYDRRVLMIASAAATTALWVVLAAADSKIWLVALVTLANLVDVPFGVAANAAIPNFVHEEELGWANGWFMSGWNFGKLVGPTLGAVVFTMAGPTAVYEINAVTFALAGVLVLTIRRSFSALAAVPGDTPAAADSGAGGEPAATFFAGFRECFRDPVIIRMLVLTTCACIAINTTLVTDVFLVQDFHGGPSAFGLLGATFGLGYLGGSMLAGRIKARREWPWVIWGSATLIVAWAVVAATPWFALVFVAVFAAALMDSVAGVVGYALVQRRIADSVRGRVLSVFDAVSTTANMAGFTIAGFAVDGLGSQGVYALGAGICLLALLGLITYRGNPYETAATARQAESAGEPELAGATMGRLS